jgi:hypothetical protein
VRSSFSSTGSHGGSSTTPSPISPPITSPDGGATVSGTDSPSTGVRAEVVVGGVVVIEALTGTIRARPYPPELRYVGLLLLPRLSPAVRGPMAFLPTIQAPNRLTLG